MAQSIDSLHGNYRGKLGNLVMYEMMGKNIVRSRPLGKPPAATGAKKQAQENFRLVMKLMQLTKHFISLGFRDVSEGRTAFNTAFSVNMKRLAEDTDPGELGWLQLSQGLRSGARDLQVVRHQPPGQGFPTLNISWGEPMEGMPYREHDSLMLLALGQSSLNYNYSLQAASRRQKIASLILPPIPAEEKVLLFAAFYDLEAMNKRKDPANISTSQMLEC